MATMKEDASGRRQRAVMATDAEWERIGRAAAESGMDLSRWGDNLVSRVAEAARTADTPGDDAAAAVADHIRRKGLSL